MNKHDFRVMCLLGISAAVGYIAARAIEEAFFPAPVRVGEIFTNDVPVDRVERIIQEMARTAPMN